MSEASYPFRPVLIVCNEKISCESISVAFRSAGIDNTISCDPSAVLEIMSRNDAAALVIDTEVSIILWEELIFKIAGRFPDIPIVVITGAGDFDTETRLMKLKVYDYMVKPVDPGRLVVSLEKAIEIQDIHSENMSLKQSLLRVSLKNPDVFSKIVASNGSLLSACKYAEAVSKSMQPVLITGEAGVGKELLARSIHDCGGRKDGFLRMNGDGLEEGRFSTLFERPGTNPEKTSFCGTFFLDGIDMLNSRMQKILFTLLREREYISPVSGSVHRMGARIIASSRRNLEDLPPERFRSDLRRKIESRSIHLPPLRERLEDIPQLLEHFLKKAAEKYGKPVPKPPAELATLLSAYHFPGNITELRSMVFEAVAQHESGRLKTTVFKKHIDENMDSVH